MSSFSGDRRRWIPAICNMSPAVFRRLIDEGMHVGYEPGEGQRA